MFKTRFYSALFLVNVSVYAAEPLPIHTIMHYSGLTGQLQSLSDELQPTVNASITACRGNVGSTLSPSLAVRYTNIHLQQKASQFLAHELNPETIAAVSAWYRSPAGHTISATELAAANWTAETFDQRIAAVQNSTDWDKTRKKQILSIISATGAHKYVASLTASISELTNLLKQCSAGLSTRSRLDAITRLDNDRALIAAFIRMELMSPSAAVLAEVPDAALDAYRSFASSAEGQHFHQTLAKVFAHILLAPDALTETR